MIDIVVKLHAAIAETCDGSDFDVLDRGDAKIAADEIERLRAELASRSALPMRGKRRRDWRTRSIATQATGENTRTKTSTHASTRAATRTLRTRFLS